MKRSQMISKIAAVIYNFNEPHSYVDRKKCLEIAEVILQVQEENGMYYCPVEDLGSIGKLRTPKGFESDISEALDKFLNETGWDDEEK